MQPCFCQQSQSYETCCQPLHLGLSFAKTAKELLFSRYAAYCCKNAEYIKQTSSSKALEHFDYQAITNSQDTWIRLRVLDEKAGRCFDSEGQIRFQAFYIPAGQKKEQGFEECSLFVREQGRWIYQKALDYFSL